MNNILVSIIIPTRNRQEYALGTVKQIISIPDRRIEVIVQDNSDNDNLGRALSKLEDNRIKYNYEKKRLSGVDNFEHASKLAKGEYVCAIGDDDGVLSSIIWCAEWMKRENIDVVKPATCVYHWPMDTTDRVLRKRQSTLKLHKYSSKYRVLDTKNGVRDTLRNGGTNYRKYDVIGSYHGLVSMKCMDLVRKKTGVCFGGLSPDIYNAMCLSLLENIKVVEIGYPITISGICSASTSAMSAAGKHVGRLEDAPHLIGTQDYKWDKRVMKFYSVETIWAETMIKAIDNMGFGIEVDKWFDSGRLVRLVLKNNYKYRKFIYENILGNVNVIDKAGHVWIQVKKGIRGYLSKINVWQREIRKKDIIYENIKDITEAYFICENELKNKKAKIDLNSNL